MIPRQYTDLSPPKAVPPAPNSRPCDLMGLTNETCRFPITDAAPHRFCGAPECDNANGVIYCSHHYRYARGAR